jgi:hypothetical protein
MDGTVADDDLGPVEPSRRKAVDDLVSSTLHVMVVQKISNGHDFGAHLPPSRGVAEQFAQQLLIELSEEEGNARSAAEVAGWGAPKHPRTVGERISPRQAQGKTAA